MSTFLPCVDRNLSPQALTLGTQRPPFAYIGKALTLDEFRSYLASLDFGLVSPDQVVIHGTANPDASWAPMSTSQATWWDRGEQGMAETVIRNKRNTQLDGVRDYYAGLGWDAGPHLWIDERWIWLFTPLSDIGIHAKEGNSYHDATGHLHYTIGIETVGYFEKFGWSPAQSVLIRGAVRALKDKLRTFEVVYHAAPTHTPAAHQGSIAFHRDYNKPSCPGTMVSNDYALKVLTAPPPPPPAINWSERWGPIATPDQTSWTWAIPVVWKAYWHQLGKCISSALYDNANGVIVQAFEGGDVRARGTQTEVTLKL